MPQISKNITPIKWIESFKDCVLRIYGISDCPFIYVIRDTVDIPDESSDPLQLGCSYGQSDSVLEEMIARLDNFNPLFKSNNSSVYSMMEEAAWGTVYAPNINPYAQKKNGRSARKAMISSHAIQDKWEQPHK